MGKAIKKAQEIAAEAVQTAAQTDGAVVAAAAPGVTTSEAAAAVSEAMKAMAAAADPQPAPAVTLDELEGMDMDAFAGGEEETGQRPEWRITDDGCADWAVRKIAEERAELARIKELADAQIQRIEEKVAAAERRCENGTRFLTGKLAEYFHTVPHKVTKTKRSYRLLSGSLTLKRAHRPNQDGGKSQVGRVQEAAPDRRSLCRRQEHRRDRGGRDRRNEAGHLHSGRVRR